MLALYNSLLDFCAVVSVGVNRSEIVCICALCSVMSVVQAGVTVHFSLVGRRAKGKNSERNERDNKIKAPLASNMKMLKVNRTNTLHCAFEAILIMLL